MIRNLLFEALHNNLIFRRSLNFKRYPKSRSADVKILSRWKSMAPDRYSDSLWNFEN